MKANATGGGAKKKSTATKVKVTGSSPTLQQVQATRQVTKAGYKVPKTTAAQRAEMATWLIPGGAAVKGAIGAAKVVKAVAGMAKASGTVKGAVYAQRAGKLARSYNKTFDKMDNAAEIGNIKLANKLDNKVQKIGQKYSNTAKKQYSAADKAMAKSRKKETAITKKLVSNPRSIKPNLPSPKAKGDTRPVKIDSARPLKSRVNKLRRPLTKAEVKQLNTATLKKLKSSGAIKRMK